MKSVLKTLIVSSLVLGGASAAQADPDLSVLFENTIVMSGEMGGRPFETKYFYNADGTVTLGSGATGTWQIKDEEMCTSIDDGRGQGREMCNEVAELAGAKPGDTWSFSPAEGVTINGAVIAGR